MTLAEETLKFARTKLGEKEATGNNDGPFVVMLDRWLDQGAGWMERQPWCATFATWCIYHAAVKIGATPMIPKLGSSSSIYSWLEKNGLLLAKPYPNCIGLIKDTRESSNKTHHHTFLVEGIDGDFVRGIDGNWKNAVSETRHAVKDCDFGLII